MRFAKIIFQPNCSKNDYELLNTANKSSIKTATFKIKNIIKEKNPKKSS